jgi:hypothetical protein
MRSSAATNCLRIQIGEDHELGPVPRRPAYAYRCVAEDFVAAEIAFDAVEPRDDLRVANGEHGPVPVAPFSMHRAARLVRTELGGKERFLCCRIGNAFALLRIFDSGNLANSARRPSRPARWDKERRLLIPRGIPRAACAMGHQVIEDLANEPASPLGYAQLRQSILSADLLETFRLLELRIFTRWVVSQTEHAIAIGPRLKSTCSASSMRMPLITGIFLVGQRKTSGRISRQRRHQSAVPRRHLALRDGRRTLDDAEARRNGRRSRHESFPMETKRPPYFFEARCWEPWEDRAGLWEPC